jgi:hypothetical protein
MPGRAALIAAALAGFVAQSAAAQSPPAAADAAEQALLTVCKPAAERQLSADVVADKAGYAREPSLPKGLPIAGPNAHSWRVPSATGQVYLISGAVPEPAQVSACMVAIYGDPATGFESLVGRRLAMPDLKFTLDPQQSITSAQYKVDHYVGQRGFLNRNVLVVRPLKAAPDHPTISVIAYRVDYSWLKSISR